ncbi:type II toxin-antitoxin system Phd/YefM family antitoxin [Rodentibacter pneumotropicus]|uniref:Plasmid stabilization protein n=1 Tax=Rodentibacter pneumotropicus TaxID=758 RepID=A0A4S2PCZ9_9PAST|nr:type II toxin-antitoxin system Phd/YefM family antitoxin [Rodentibacter pneumotropicus]THA00466.1 plasmid stabilization protein [Rodentibacter pneumotropicus]THA00717.1 plasmid stabilization protein [Rodentibacter pneumotropicus]THA06974.1 plasmid stabilization protein [Rodentibacter pneumotropicus]THA14873.1 plasmid stabilization protein [Rodentibacter pneumotropicus]
MPSIILTNTVASITELKTNPMATFNAAGGEAIAILNRNEPAFYCVPPRVYEYLMELADDAELARIVEERQHEQSYAVDLNDLLK